MRNKYSKEFEKYIKEKSKYLCENNIRQLAEKKFDIVLSKGAFDTYLYRHHIKCIDYNKNKIRQKSLNRTPVGTERITSRGMVLVKIANPDVWEWKNRLMYEKYYNCKLTSNDIILFLNKNKMDFSKENLVKISRKECLMLIGKNKLTSINREITKTGILITKLRIKTKELKKHQ